MPGGFLGFVFWVLVCCVFFLKVTFLYKGSYIFSNGFQNGDFTRFPHAHRLIPSLPPKPAGPIAAWVILG